MFVCVPNARPACSESIINGSFSSLTLKVDGICFLWLSMYSRNLDRSTCQTSGMRACVYVYVEQSLGTHVSREVCELGFWVQMTCFLGFCAVHGRRVKHTSDLLCRWNRGCIACRCYCAIKNSNVQHEHQARYQHDMAYPHDCYVFAGWMCSGNAVWTNLAMTFAVLCFVSCSLATLLHQRELAP